MGKCFRHPDIETSFYCQKYEQYKCDDCMKCSDPDLYCKFRSACLIWYLEKESDKDEKEAEV